MVIHIALPSIFLVLLLEGNWDLAGLELLETHPQGLWRVNGLVLFSLTSPRMRPSRALENGLCRIFSLYKNSWPGRWEVTEI